MEITIKRKGKGEGRGSYLGLGKMRRKYGGQDYGGSPENLYDLGENRKTQEGKGIKMEWDIEYIYIGKRGG